MITIHTFRAATFAAAFALAGCSTMSTTSGATSTDLATGNVTVTGRVTTRDGRPVANARVYVPGTGAATRTDANGNYTLTGIPGGPQRVVVRSFGYVPAEMDAKLSTKPSDAERNNINVTLATPEQAAAVASLRESDSAALAKVGFLQRESSIRGAYFITPDQIEQQRPARLTDIFRGVPVLEETPGTYGPVLRGMRGCLLLYVDGLPWRAMFPGDLNTDIPVRDVIAAEVYPPGLAAPAPFVRGSLRPNCTTVGIWTRSALG
ncbi:MAG: carboxypeptidase regulatory-like domain-containing protein [Gemmatimonadaceae bacterium]